MASMNVCVFTGNLTRDVETKMVGESEVAKFSIAVNGLKDDDVFYLDIDYWRPSQALLEYLVRGKSVAVSGRLQVRKYEKDGEERKAYSLNCRELTLLSNRDRQTEKAF